MTPTYELMHIGIHSDNEQQAEELASLLGLLFHFEVKPGQKSIFAGSAFECMKFSYLGTHGHIAMAASDLVAAVEELTARGFSFRSETAQYNAENKLSNIYLNGEYGGFAIHIMQKK